MSFYKCLALAVGLLVLNVTFLYCHEIASATIENAPVESQVQGKLPSVLNFARYVENFGKNYSPIETLVRAKVFLARTLSIFKHNFMFLCKKKNYFLEQNQYTDLTPDEIKSKFSVDLGLKPVDEASSRHDVTSKASSGDQRDLDVSGAGSSSEVSLNFLEKQEVGNLHEVLTQLNTTDRRLMKKVTDFVDLKEDAVALMKENLTIPKEKLVPIVKSNNKNYDFELVRSQAGSAPLGTQKRDKDFTNFVLDDFMIEPYHLPDFHAEETGNEDGWTIIDFVGSIKVIYDMINQGVQKLYDGEWTTSTNKTIETSNTPEKRDKIDPSIIGEVKYNIDWRIKGCLTKPKSQLDCNSCYAFAMLDLLEFNYCRQKKQLTQFSAQYIIDCGHKSGLQGCKGGKLSSVGHFVRQYGVELQAIYPYKARQETCPYDESHDKAKKSGYLRPEVRLFEIRQMSTWIDWLRRAPLVVGINMPSDFLAYGGGLHDGSNCIDNMVHAMVLVGTGVQDGKPFWLLRNTFSEEWGEDGYIRLAKSASEKCFYVAVYMKAKF